MLTVKSRNWPARTVSVVRTWPKPLARASTSYVPGTSLNVSLNGVPCSVSAIGVGARLVAAHEQLGRFTRGVARRPEPHRRLVRVRRVERGHRIEVLVAVAARRLPEAALGEGVPHDVEVDAVVAELVGGQDRVAGVEHAHVPGRHQQPGVEHELHPAATPAVAVAADERLPDVVVGRAPDLAVGVDLRALRAQRVVADEVVADVGVVERAVVHPEVADAGHLVAGHVRSDRERVLAADRREAALVQVLGRHQVRPALAHGLRLVAGQAGARAAHHAVGDRVAVLVADHRHVVVAVHARGVEAGGDRLPEVHVRDRQQAVGRA